MVGALAALATAARARCFVVVSVVRCERSTQWLATLSTCGTSATRVLSRIASPGTEPTSDCSARLMKAAQEYGILCDCVTQELAADTVEFQELPSITVKGKSGPIRVFHPSRRARERTRVGVRRDADSILHIVKEVPLTHTDPTFLGGHVAVRSTKSLVGKRRKPCWPPRSAPSCSRPRTMAA